MPTPRWIAHLNRIGLNRLTRFIAPYSPGWGLVIHRGRKSGKVFHTPLWVFRRGDTFVIALTYGSRSDWVRNVVAADGCELRTRGKHYVLTEPRVYQDRTAAAMPLPIRAMLRWVLRAPEFLTFAPAKPA
ncbi:MAG: nitroreductase family deazaflavin-dependent oxidoreductase [Mycobacteriaceae bacterium]|nr:nitroreductase family deazaflavin-dependent oxidoreductase [Mycobacteriaceae bacterium]